MYHVLLSINLLIIYEYDWMCKCKPFDLLINIMADLRFLIMSMK